MIITELKTVMIKILVYFFNFIFSPEYSIHNWETRLRHHPLTINFIDSLHFYWQLHCVCMGFNFKANYCNRCWNHVISMLEQLGILRTHIGLLILHAPTHTQHKSVMKKKQYRKKESLRSTIPILNPYVITSIIRI